MTNNFNRFSTEYKELETLWYMQSALLWSYSHQDDQILKNEIPKKIDFIQEFYKVSNKTINHVLGLAQKRESNHFNTYFSSIFKPAEIVINPNLDIKKLVTIN